MKPRDLLQYLIPIAVLAAIAIFFCSPILRGHAVVQPDIVQYKGMAQESIEFRETQGEESYWSNAMFGGMPTYQTGARYSGDWLGYVDGALRFLPRPADYLLLGFLGFFLLGMVVTNDWKAACVGAILFGLGTYFVILIAAGHNAKLHAIGYFAPLAAGILALYKGKYVWGFLGTTLFLALELRTNHPQMTFYFFLVMLVFFGVELFRTLKSKNWKPFLSSTALVVLAGVLALGMNAARYLTTYEYSQHTIRGKSDVTLVDQNNTGLEKDYITQWSYGKLETLNLLIPNFMGGESGGDQDKMKAYANAIQKAAATSLKSETDEQLLGFAAQHQLYWGDQPGTSGPAYQGAVVIFLFVLGLILIRGEWKPYKWWLLIATALSIALAWGKNFSFLTDLFIDYFPFYDKFRSVSSILVMAEFTMPLLALLALVYALDKEKDNLRLQKTILYTMGGFFVFFALIYVGADGVFGFLSEQDKLLREQFMSIVGEYQPNRAGEWNQVIGQIEKGIVSDRVALMQSDVLRSGFFALATGLILFGFTKKIIRQKMIVYGLVALLALTDVFGVGKRYLSEEDFVPKEFVENPYPTDDTPNLQRYAAKNPHIANMARRLPYNQTLLDLKQKDKGVYRVFNNLFSPFQEANTSYFHHSIGGYHGAKLSSIQNLIDLYFSNDDKAKQLGTDGKGIQILNLMNAKYSIGGSMQQPKINYNENALGNVWYVSEAQVVNDANEEILGLKDIQPRKTALIRKGEAEKLKTKKFVSDSTQQIKLTKYTPNRLTYSFDNSSNALAVFSEMYFPEGWQARINDKEATIVRLNYFLRGLEVPKGKGQIVFEFRPASVQMASSLGYVASAVFLLVGIGMFYRQKIVGLKK